VLADERSVGRSRAASVRRGTRSVVVAPLMVRGEVIGTLAAVNTRDDAIFTEEDTALVEQLAAQAAIAIENARLYEETQRQSERLAQTLTLSEMLHGGLELEQVLEQIAQGAVRLGFRRAVINVCQLEEDVVRVRAIAGLEGPEREELMGATYRWSDLQTLMQERFQVSHSYLIRQGEVDWDKDLLGVVITTNSEDRGPGYWRPEDMLLVPLWGTHGQPVGLLSMDEPVDGLLPDLNTIQTLEAFANQAAIAIENARLFEETERLKAFNENVVQGVAEAILIEDAQGILTFANPAVEELLGYTRKELIGLDWTTIVPRDKREKVRQETAKRPQGIVGRYETVLLDKKGEHIPVIVSARPLFEENEFAGVLSAFTDITELKQAEEALRDEKTLMDALMDNIPDSIYFKDRQCRLIRINRKMMQDLNLDEMSQAIGKTDVDLFGEEFGRKTLAEDQHIMTTGEPIIGLIESRQLEDGQVNWTLSTKVPLPDASGQIMGLVGVTREINELKRAEEELRASEEKFRQFFENEPEYCYMISPEGVILDVNSAALKALGYGKEELVGKPLKTICAPASLPKMEQLFAKWKKTGHLKNEEIVIITKKGGRRTVLHSAGVVKDRDGKTLHSVSVQRDITQRKRAEREIEERRLYLEGVLGAAPDAIVTTDARHRIVEWNSGAERLFGYSREEVIGQNLDHLITNPDVFEEAIGFTQAVMSGKDLPPVETVRYRKDGSPVDVIVAGSPILVGGELIGLVAVYTNITQRKRAEEALRESEEKYRTILEDIEDGYYEVDVAGNFTFFNDALCRIFGYPADELMGMNERQLMDDETAKIVYQTFNAVYRTGEPAKALEHEFIRKDGARRSVEVSVSLISDSAGEPAGFRGIIRDITQRKRAEREIEERRLYLEGVLGAAPDAIVTADARHRIVEWNSGAERLFGYSREEVIGQNLDHLVTNPDVFEEAIGFTQVVKSGREVSPVETVRYRKDGSSVDVIVAASPILVGDELVGIVAVYTDITRRKRMEEALRASLLVDELTGLYNRRGFSTLGQQQLKMAHRTKSKMSLLFADFDELKRINDTLGHHEGDLALIEIANVLKEIFRESDIIARIGGDEFVVLVIETDGVSAETLTTRLQENLEVRNARGDRRYKLSLSVGIARYDPKHPCSIDELLARADRLMYEQKQDDQMR
jgi:diguanylate cyclase (GGDEF)-like protein/PAS domain S-box-containing protein